MKRVYLYILLAVLCACSNQDQNEPTGANFEYDRIAPLMVRFYNLSGGCISYRWDFGDGMWSVGENAIHTYEQIGTYNVTLTGETASGYKYTHSETIELTEPQMYFSGVVFYKIPYENRYYKVIFKDDNLLPSSWDFQTNYTPMLDNTYLPYLYKFAEPRLLISPESHNYYSIQVMRSSNASTGTDAQCLRQQLKVSDLMQYQPEYILRTETGLTAIGIVMEYDY